LKKTLLCTIAVWSACLAQAGQACGPKRMHRGAQPVSCAQPAYAPQMVAYAQPTYASPQVAYAQPTYAQPALAAQQPASAPAPVAPTYNYQPASEDRPAYYYSYDNSGKLIVTQWADWLFRGGKQAGMARPPLPVIGLLRDN